VEEGQTGRKPGKKALLLADLEKGLTGRRQKKALLVADLEKNIKEGFTGSRPGEKDKRRDYW
jgi:hypothetical protein